MPTDSITTSSTCCNSYQIGATVRLRKESIYYSQAQGQTGKIVGLKVKPNFEFLVKWETDLYPHLNYNREDLEVVTTSPSVKVVSNIQAEDIVKILDLGACYSRELRETYIGRYYKVLEIEDYFLNGWFACSLVSTDPSRPNNLHFGKVRLLKLVKPVQTKGEEGGNPNKTTK